MYRLPPITNTGSSFSQGVESGFETFFPRYPPSSSLSVNYPFNPSTVPSQRHFIPGPYYGYGTANNVWSPQIGYDNVPLMAHSPVANQFLRDSLLDRENFQSRGCGWDQARGMCSDLLGICKGGCQDFRSRNQFSNFPSLPDCRCVPLGYSFLMGGKQKFN
ncbi:hypothetical protein ACQ4LE_007211 [Meloidogyne hapla]